MVAFPQQVAQQVGRLPAVDLHQEGAQVLAHEPPGRAVRLKVDAIVFEPFLLPVDPHGVFLHPTRQERVCILVHRDDRRIDGLGRREAFFFSSRRRHTRSLCDWSSDVCSSDLWSRHFGKDSSVLNQQLIVNGTALTVVGVARAGFTGIQVGQTPDLFIPITMKPLMTPNRNGLEDRSDHWTAILGRLKPGQTRTQGQAGLQPLYSAILESEASLLKLPASQRQQFLRRPILLEVGSHGRQIVQQDAEQPLLFLSGMVGLVLLIAGANLASLLIARGEARQREFALRLALGATRQRIIRQLFTESVILALAGGVTGVAIAYWTSAALVRVLSAGAGILGLDSRLDYRVLGFAIVLTVAAAAIFGLAPAFRTSRLELNDALKQQGATVSGARSNMRVRKGLIISQVALTTALLMGAGLFTHSLTNLRRLNLGLQPEHVVQFSVAPELSRYSPAQTVAFCDRLRHTVAQIPGVRSVSAALIPILADSDASSDVTVEGYVTAPDEDTDTGQNWVGPNYFATMETPIREGREFGEDEKLDTPKVAIVNETFARKFFPHGDVIGRHFTFGQGNVHPDIEIVGVVGDSKYSRVRNPSMPFVYLPYAQRNSPGVVTFYVRTVQEPSAMEDTLRKTVAELDPALPIYALRTLNEQIDQSLFADRFVTFLALCLASLAGLLAAVGLYGVMAYLVFRRTREIGVRMALGASRRRIAGIVLREVLRTTFIGLGAGLVIAVSLGRLVESQLFGVKASDPLVFASVIGLLSAIALLAGGLPARKAATLEPMNALRYE